MADRQLLYINGVFVFPSKNDNIFLNVCEVEFYFCTLPQLAQVAYSSYLRILVGSKAVVQATINFFHRAQLCVRSVP